MHTIPTKDENTDYEAQQLTRGLDATKVTIHVLSASSSAACWSETYIAVDCRSGTGAWVVSRPARWHVASTDQHTVKPWFAGKLDYSPQVVDLTSSGYPLIGGRLDVLDHRNVAAIIYQRRKHYINLFIWPSDTVSLQGRLYNQNGYHALGWTKSGMNYLAVSELGENELREFVGMIQARTIESRPGE